MQVNAIPAWLVGGWGIDALLGEQIRPHKDLDLLVRLDDVARLRELLSSEGFTLKELWEENQIVPDRARRMVETGFVLREPGGLELDIHALRDGAEGCMLPAWMDSELRCYTPQDLGGEGVVGGMSVRCISAQMQLRGHTGYTLPEYQKDDLARLCARFHLPLPVGV